MEYVAGIDGHTSYLVVAVVSEDGEVRDRSRVGVSEPGRLSIFSRYRGLEVVVETSSTWPWIRDLVVPLGNRFVLAHAKRLRHIASSNYNAMRSTQSCQPACTWRV